MGVRTIFTTTGSDNLVVMFGDGQEVAMGCSLIASEIQEKDLNGITAIKGIIDTKTLKPINNLPQVLMGVFLGIKNDKYDLRLTDGTKKQITKEEAKTLRNIVMRD